MFTLVQSIDYYNSGLRLLIELVKTEQWVVEGVVSQTAL
jgi:hypothetical protein